MQKIVYLFLQTFGRLTQKCFRFLRFHLKNLLFSQDTNNPPPVSYAKFYWFRMSHLKAHYPNQKLKGAAAEAKCWRWLFIEILLSCPIVARGKSWLDRSSAKRNQFETCCTLIEKVVGQLKRRDNFDHFDWGMIDNFIFTRQQLMLLRDVV